MKNSVKKFLLSNWSLQEKGLLAADLVLLGVLVGWLTSPFRHAGSFLHFDVTAENLEEAEENS